MHEITTILVTDRKDVAANARLIAAAPTMLAVLKAAEIAIENCHKFRSHHHFDTLALIKAAITKATEGRT